MGHRAHRLLLVLLGVCDATHTVPAHLHDDSADLVQQFLFAGRLGERLVAGTQGTQRPIQASKFLVDLAVAIAGGNLGRTRIGTRSCGHLRALVRRRGAWVFRIRFILRQGIAGQPRSSPPRNSVHISPMIPDNVSGVPIPEQEL